MPAADLLPAFIARAEAEPFSFGEWDCCLWLAEWGRELTGIDGGVAWRGRYRTALGCHRLLTREGGVAAVVKRGALACGMTQREAARPGAVGVIEVITAKGRRPVGALFTGRRWVVLRHGGGVLGLNAPAITVWGL
jgi:hypothetical protein